LSLLLSSSQHDAETFRAHYPSAVDDSWTNEGENTHFHFVDLHRNPERYTGHVAWQ
jgi:hypothetical protein